MSKELERLKQIGFVLVGGWLCDGDGIAFEHHTTESARRVLDAQHALYAFVCDEQLKYVGKTVRGVKNRMSNYRNADISQRTNNRTRDSIVKCLKEDSRVDVYAFADNGLFCFGGFHINLAAGLEDSLIKELKPEWNGGRKETTDETLEPLDPTTGNKSE